MDPLLYKNEIDRLTKEISTLKETSDCPNVSIWTYKYYFAIVGVLGLFLYVVKPKYILEIDICDDQNPRIIVSTKYFLLCWIVSSVLGCLAYFIFKKYKKE